MESNQNKVTNKNKSLNCKNNKKSFGLDNYTYADYIILSSTLAYAIGEELNDEDLAFFIVFLSQVSSDLALIRTKRAVEISKLAKSQEDEQDTIESIDIDSIDDTLTTTLERSKQKKIKKRKIKKKKKT